MIDALRDLEFASHWNFLVKHWTDGDVTCLLTNSYEEQTFRISTGYVLVLREEFIQALHELYQFKHGKPPLPRGALKGRRKVDTQKKHLAPVLSARLPDEPRADYGASIDER